LNSEASGLPIEEKNSDLVFDTIHQRYYVGIRSKSFYISAWKFTKNSIEKGDMKKLVKVTTDKKVFGVFSRLAKFFGFDTTLVRLVFVITTILGFGSPILVYLILAFIMPKDIDI
jgi:phage shock protein PspC (stress-responsive transcriptional regulator)